MKLVFVVDMYNSHNNGTTMTAYRFVEALKTRGHEVRVVAIGEPAEDNYFVPEANYGVVSKWGHTEGFCFAKINEDTFRRAFEGADLVHFLLPMPFERRAAKIARQMGIPTSAAFHLQPENVTAYFRLDKSKMTNTAMYRFLYKFFYKDFDHIHCPSRFIAKELKKNGYKAKLYVISNGVDNDFAPKHVEPITDKSKFNILMIGRLAPEKSQKTLIDAIACSKHADDIQLYLAGKGPCEKALRKQAEKLKNPLIIDFYSKEDLITLINSCDLYVHSAYVEIEAIACIEAFTCGLVPVICNAPKSATVQFALDDRSLFRVNDARDLARKIDYWIDHPELRAIMSTKYAMQGNQYRVSESVRKAEYMFTETIADYKEKYGDGQANQPGN